ncbi:MAG: alpha-L-arabinofuranosidase C-terminal domain-containing protein [Breznakibacter sp.]
MRISKSHNATVLLWALSLWCMPLLAKAFNEPDSVYLFAYATDKNHNRNGLHYAYSTDQANWFPIGNEHRFLFCDYGRWGAEKRLIMPYLLLAPNGLWHCIWSVNERDGTFAHSVTADLLYWKPQSYPTVMENNNCLMPEATYDPQSKLYTITWLGNADGKERCYGTTTADFKTYSPAREIDVTTRVNNRQTLVVDGATGTGTVHKVAWETVDALIKAHQLITYKNQLHNELAKDDSLRFGSLKSVNAAVTVDALNAKPISNMLMGIFFEDINYAADGGLYAELVQNRGFEYQPSDREGRDKTWNSDKAWQIKGHGTVFTIDTVGPIHPNNKHYAVLNVARPGAALVNEGFDGIAVKAGEKYDLSVFLRQQQGKGAIVKARLVAPNGETIGETVLKPASSTWKRQGAVITVTRTEANAQLELIPQKEGVLAVDMVSLFPQNTFKKRPNGLHADLAQSIADLHPRFVRFPGGCVAHGDGIANIYRWQNTIGPLEARKPQRNLWGYHQTAGLGYFEDFQFCEDIGAEPLPVVAAGVPCQNSGTGGAGQQGGIPMCEMDNYIREVLDLIEWANGSVNTFWGKKRAEAGHPKPFNLKYVGIGNEDLITDIFEERFTLLYNAVKEKHPEITVVGTVGPFFEGTDYVEGWNIATKLGVPMVDEHYYNPPGWFIHNQDFYDRYDRSKPKVYLGEYAAHVPGRHNNIETALAEALHLTTLERNGDVVSMASYAPLLAKEGHTQWNPDLIYFNNSEVKPTVGYYVQKLFGQNAGNVYLPGKTLLDQQADGIRKRVAVSTVRDANTNDVIVKLVNLLPVPVNTSIDLKGIAVASPSAVKSVLTGHPADKNARPTESFCPVSEKFRYRISPVFIHRYPH